MMRTPKQPPAKQVTTWTIHFFGPKLTWLALSRLFDEEAALAAAVIEFKKDARKLIATRE
jgi:hypothetical protein